MLELTTLRRVLHSELDASRLRRAHDLVDEALVRYVGEAGRALAAAREEAERDREKVLSVVVHDLKNPLNTILLGTAVLESGDPLPDDFMCDDVGFRSWRVVRALVRGGRGTDPIVLVHDLDARGDPPSCRRR